MGIKIKSIQIILLYFFLSTIKGSLALATTYYVSNLGNNNHLGTSSLTAWETISKVNSESFQPGDSVLFRRGDTWRNDPLQMTSSGNSTNQIVFGTYGSGAKPEILGSVLAEDWTNVSGNVWASSIHFTDDPWEIGYDGPEIFFEEIDQSVTWGTHQSYDAAFSNLSKEYDWTWHNNTIYIYSPSDPDSRYVEVEVPQQEEGIYLMDQNYITIDGLAIKYYADAGIYDQYATIELFGLRVTHCEIAYIGQKDGAAAYGLSVHHSDSYYAYNEIHNCGRRSISLTIYQTDPITQSNVIIEHNHFHHGWHTTSLDCSTTGEHTIEDIIFRNNYVEGSPDIQLDGVNPNSNHVFMDNQASGGALIRNIWFYNNIFTYAHGSSIKIGEVANVNIYNNTFYNFNPTLANWQAHVYLSSTSGTTTVRNNIFYNNSVDNRLTAIKVDEESRHLVEVNNNLYYQSAEGKRFFWINNGTSYRVDEWDTYKSATGNDADSPEPSDPLFINPPINFGLDEFSPARGEGISSDWIATDYNGFAMNVPPDLGAIQYGSVVGIATGVVQKKFILYPNPANDFCKIEFSDEASGTYSIQIVDLYGRIVYNRTKHIGERSIHISLNHFPKGLYFITVSDGLAYTENEKLIIF